MFFFKVKPKRNRTEKAEEARLSAMMQQALGGYVKREELESCLVSIQKDDNRRRVWASLSTRQKIKVLKHVLEQKGGQSGGRKTGV